MKSIVLVVALLAVALAVTPAPFTVPQQYYVEFGFGVPQWAASGMAPVVEPVKFWYDGVHDQERIDYWAGEDVTVVQNASTSSPTLFHSYPRGTQKTCDKSVRSVQLATAFPFDLNQFKYQKSVMINGKACDEWLRYVPVESGATNNFTFYVDSSTKAPVRYTYIGYTQGSLGGFLESPNYDWFQIDYTSWKPNYYDASAFTPPAPCNSATHDHKLVRSPMSMLHHLVPLHPVQKEHMWADWKFQHGKEYESKEHHDDARAQFFENEELIGSHNRWAHVGKHSFHMALNLFADRHPKDVAAERNGWRGRIVLPGTAEGKKVKWHKDTGKGSPDSVDWRTKGAVSPLKDQGDCGSCWSFSSTGAAESAYFLKHGKMPLLSEQYVLDCSASMNQACDGGEQAATYKHVIELGGKWPSEAAYPYHMNEGFCKSVNTSEATVTDYHHVIPFSQIALKDALANVGPIAISVDASYWTFYHSGVYDGKCNPITLDHAVMAVGYGTMSGKDYWIVKNSWSKYYGMDGYILVDRAMNHCGVETSPLYPVVA